MHRAAIRLALGCCLLVGTGCVRDPPRPHVIVLVLDTLRSDHLGCYGYRRPTSPNIDRIAADGVVYERAVATAPWTLPSHATLFTGLLPSRHGAHHEHLRLDEGRTTVAELLSEIGYETVGFSNNPWITPGLGLAQGFERFEEIWRERVSKGTFEINVFVDPATHGMEDAGAAATLQSIRGWLDAREPGRPFFLFVNLIEAHAYFDPPAAFRHRFLNANLGRAAVRQENLDYVRRAFRDELEPARLERIQALYDGEVAYLDSWVGALFETLERRDLANDTLLILTSDHGEAFAEHRLCGVPLIDHQLSLYRELLDVPLVVRFPLENAAGAANGRRVAVPVSTADVVPTILDVVGRGPRDGLDGRSLAGELPSADRLLFAEYYRPLVHLGLLHGHVRDAATLDCMVDRRLVSVQSAGRKLILEGRGHTTLFFDHDADPGELTPLASPPAAIAGPLLEAAEDSLRRMQTGARLAPPQLDDAWRETLRSLGYVE